jgi:hypothetical protein
VKTTPFYQLVLNLLENASSLHSAEQRLLMDFLGSVPKVGKQAPSEFISEVERSECGKFKKDLSPYRKAHAENMPHTSLLHSSELGLTISDTSPSSDISSSSRKTIWSTIESDELQLDALLPAIIRPLPQSNESYIIEDVVLV